MASDIRVPTLVIHCTSNPIFPNEHGEARESAVKEAISFESKAVAMNYTRLTGHRPSGILTTVMIRTWSDVAIQCE
jgi:hypothetical protein